MFKCTAILSFAIIPGLCCLTYVRQVTAQQVTVEPARNAADADQKAKILASARWKQVSEEFSQWLSMQVVYTPKQIEELKAKLAAQTQSMSEEELQGFLDEWEAKLKILLGKDAMEAREWLGQNLAIMADGYRKEVLEKLGVGDASTMTAAQVEEGVIRVRAQRMSLQQRSAAFQRSRDAMVKSVEQANASQQAAAASRSASRPAASYRAPTSAPVVRRQQYQVPPPLISRMGWYWW